MGVNEIIQIDSKMKVKRKEAGYTQKSVAEILGIPYTTYSNYENNNREPTYQIVERFCQELKIGINELLSVPRTDHCCQLRRPRTLTS